MIFLAHVKPDPPKEFGPQLAKDDSAFEQQKKLNDARQHIKSFPKNKLKSKDFKNLWGAYKSIFIEAQFKGKCAYCEDRIVAAYPGDVEHYRPKAEVAHYSRRGNRNDYEGSPNRGRKIIDHKPGYWWLAFDWNNWLLACKKCNSSWKANQFPVQKMVLKLQPGVEQSEDPLLINPFLKDPQGHFKYWETGKIEAATNEGQASINVCGLDRSSLISERERIASSLMKHLDDLEYYQETQNREGVRRTINHLWDFCKDEARFAGMARYLVEENGILWDDLRSIFQNSGH